MASNSLNKGNRKFIIIIADDSLAPPCLFFLKMIIEAVGFKYIMNIVIRDVDEYY